MTGEPHSFTHPPLPPTEKDDRFARLRLLRSRRVGIATYHRLMAEHGSAAAALDALPEVARAAGVEKYTICPEGVVQAELTAAHRAGARLIAFGDPAYPAQLSQIADAPPFLWAIGDADLLHKPMIAMVGARNASSLGGRMARKLAEGLAEAGFVVISGMARGIDAVAHQATLDTGTIAVMAGGVDHIYPAENAELAERIGAKGLRISEQPMGMTAQARHFPARNRIIAGAAQAVVVVEAAAKSGSLITARNALDQGRDVLAVPGHPFDGRAAGCNMLLRDGAILVRSAEDVIDHVGPPTGLPEQPVLPKIAAAPQPRPLRDSAALHSQILDRLGPSPMAEDQLIRDLAATSHEVAPALTTLELDGQIVRQAGGLLSRVH